MEIKYEWILGGYAYVDDALVLECSELYSEHYGKWGAHEEEKYGRNIKLSPGRLKVWLEDANSAIHLAREENKLVGYAIALRIMVPNYGIISWVTQLVVHEDYRHNDIAKSLLFSIWGFTNDFAWGIISANPYAIRALEKATRRRSDPIRIKHNIRKLLSLGIEHVPYMSKEIKHFITEESSRVNTQFYQDLSQLENMLGNVTTEDVPWKLGKLEEGWEWLAFTFQDQLPINMSNVEISKMLEASDRVVQMAYARMEISSDHKWAKHTTEEVDFIIKECNLSPSNSIIDFGCGTGRHAFLLAQNGINVQAVDYVDKLIDSAKRHQQELGLLNVDFMLGDCRTIRLKKSKAIICLYDVIGSYADNDENLRILNNVSEHLEKGGIALISVMNYELTLNQAKNHFTIKSDPNKLLYLKPSNTMELTGNIFDPDYYIVDTEAHVIYRREQFQRGKALPIELIVRDRRFNRNEIIEMCDSVGLKVEFARYVNAKDWREELDPTSNNAKEILVKCVKI